MAEDTAAASCCIEMGREGREGGRESWLGWEGEEDNITFEGLEKNCDWLFDLAWTDMEFIHTDEHEQ